MDKYSDQNQQSQQQASTNLNKQSQAEEVVVFKSASPEIPQNVEFTAEPAGADEVARWQRKSAHDTLARWLSGDHAPNNDFRHVESDSR